MWNDSETNSDFIDYQHYVNAVLKIINNDDLLPCSIGVFGDWGSGKSSLMKMVAEKYESDKDVLVIKFNGWLFEGYEDTKTVLMGRIVDEIIRNRTFSEKASKLAAKLLKKIDIIKISGAVAKYGLGFAAMGPAGVAALSIGDVMSKLKDVDYDAYIKQMQSKDDIDNTVRNNIQEFHQNFEELINETNIKKIIVLIDDLDRCSTDTIIGTLEAIKLFLFTKQTAFILGADERLIKYAVRRRFPEIPGDTTEVGRDYLEKLIQYPVRIPVLSHIELTTYINLLFTKLYVDIGEFDYIRENVIKEKNIKGFDFIYNISNAKDFVSTVSTDLEDALILSAQITPVLSVGLNGNPRQCKRFLNTLLLRYEMASSKNIALNKRILAKLMLLEYFKPETFKQFYENQLQNNGLIKDVEKLESYSNDVAPGTDSKLTTDQEAYLQDGWIKNWLKSEPSLKEQNLQPYYYFSRDKITGTSVHMQRMSPEAQETYRKMLNDSDAIKAAGIKECTDLNSGDAAAILESLIEKVSQNENQSGENIALKVLFDFCKVRVELQSQLYIFLDRVPEQLLTISAVTWIIDISRGGAFEEKAKEIITKWSNSGNKNLAKISKLKLKQL
ncbi:MAG: hypothetical protein JWO44_195 [Bacteroidetes bacterium]|nr:hypothetical protein [Bacteroidota bacterium]